MLIRALCQNLGNKNMLKVKASSLLRTSIEQLAKGFCTVATILLIGLSNVQADGMGGASLGQQNPALGPDDPCNGGTAAGTSKPISMFSGAELYRHVDLTLPGVMPIQLIRRYDSRTTYDSPLGFGWAFAHDRRLFEYRDLSVVIRKGCGERTKFVFSGGTYVTPGGTKGQLASDGNGGFIYSYLSGFQDFYDQQGRLTIQQDALGNRIEYTYSAQKLPLIGTSNNSIDPKKPMVVAFHYQLARIETRLVNGSLTGRYVDFSYQPTTGRLIKATSSDGKEVTYSHQTVLQGETTSTNGNLISVSLPNQIVHSYQYNDVNDTHDVTYIQEGAGAVPFVNTYNADGKVISQQYGVSKIDINYTVDFSSSNLTQTIVDNEGAIIHSATEQYEFNPSGYLTKKVNHSGQTLKLLYDSNNRKIGAERWMTNVADNTQILQERVEFDYDSVGNQTSTSVYNGVNLLYKFQSTYTDKNKIESSSIIAPDGETRTTSFSYNADLTLKSIDGPRTDVADITTFTYDENKNLKTLTNAINQTTKFENYDSDGFPLTITGPNNIVHQLAYYPNGLTKSIISNGLTTSVEWDELDRLKKLITPNGQSIEYEYLLLTDSNPKPLATQAGLAYGNQRSGSDFGLNSEDPFQRVRYVVNAVEDNLGNRIEIEFDSFGNSKKYRLKDSDGNVKFQQTQSFDNLGQLFKQLGENGQSTEFNYDAHGNLSSITNGLDKKTVAEFNHLNQLKKITDPLNGSTEYEYDAYLDLISVTDASNKKTEYEYSAFSELTKLTSPDTGITKYTYDAASNLLTSTDARNVKTTMTYDALNRIVTESFDDPSENIVYTYDETTNGNKGVGQLTKITDKSGSINYVYNSFGYISKETRVIDGKIYITLYGFDDKGQLNTITYPNGRILTYSFDTLGRVTGLTTTYQNQTKVLASNITYLPFGPMSNLTYGNGKQLAQTYDLDYRLTGKSVNGITGFSYSFDVMNNVTSVNDSITPSNNQTFVYDELSRLTSAQGAYGEFGYTFDAIDNRITETKNGSTTNYTYAENTHHLNQVKGVTTTNLTYDQTGNTLTKGSLTFTYNQRGRLKSASKIGMNVEYEYNANGERVTKLVEGIKTHFIYDLWGQLIAEADGNGVIQKEYIYLNGQRITSVSGSNLYYVHTDHLDTPIALTDEAGTVQWKAHYTPYGMPILEINNLEQLARFPGQYFDQETGLHYNYFRDYDPEIGRYIQSDPIGLNGGVSTYGYAYQNPITNIDPFGLEVTGEWVKEPELNNVSATPICDANGQCGTNAPFPPKIKGILPPKVYAGSVQFNVKATVDWVILCKDSEDCGETEEWLLTGGNQLNNNVSIPIWVPLFSHPVLTAYNIANLGEQAIDQSIKHFDEAVMLYKGSIDPTNWCIVMPRR